VEANRISTSLLARSAVERKYLTVEYIVDLLLRKTPTFSWFDPVEVHEAP
jgi:hypothetical protein